MSKPIHTAGPIAVDEFSNLYLARHIANGSAISGAPSLAVTTNGSDSWPEDEKFKCKANARLLAAAYNAFDSAGKKLGLNAVLLAEGLQHGAIADLIGALEQAREHIDGEIDVVDGDYGVPAPNKAMSLAHEIDVALAKVKGGAA